MTAPPRAGAVPGRGRLIVALDLPDADAALVLGGRVAPFCGTLKLGLELFCAAGPDAVRRLSALAPVFLDLKLHDIPNTVAGAVRALAPLHASLLTVHAGGGAAMVAAARGAAEAAGATRPLILAVTVLTSLDDAALRETGVADDAAGQVRRLAAMALAAGADGLVCSPREVALLRDAHGPAPLLVVPGIRPEGAAAGDQARTATPRAAVAAGADRIVVGRPITGAPDPAAAAAAVAADLDG